MIRDLFSKRAARAAKAGVPDVYQYDTLPDVFKMQVVHIWERAISRDLVVGTISRREVVWALVEKEIAEDSGQYSLGDASDPFLRVCNYFLNSRTETARALDAIEIVFAIIDEHVRPIWRFSAPGRQHPDAALADINQRFREHSIGLQYVGGQIVRVDSQYLHAEAVKPALALLQAEGFAGPEDEFMVAHKHYRDGKYKEAMNEALKAFESTLKAICTARRWAYDKNKDTAKTLIEIVLREGLIPAYQEMSLGGLRSLLESAVPTTRNRESGHGQGPEPKTVPDYVAAYALHATATNIVFLVEAHRAKG